MRPSFLASLLCLSLVACSSPDLSLLAPTVDSDAGTAMDTGTAADTVPGTDADTTDTPMDVPTDQPADDAVTDTGVDVRVTARCGDGMCTAPAETCTNCPADCGMCPARCGDGMCTAPRETCTTCPMDCGPCDACAGASTCGTCTPMSNCGWCKNTNHCLTGTSTAPTNRECAGADWAWQTNQCTSTMTDPCPGFTDCATCAAQPTCGWCANVNRCLAGSTMGPNNGACRGADWRPTAMTCRGG